MTQSKSPASSSLNGDLSEGFPALTMPIRVQLTSEKIQSLIKIRNHMLTIQERMPSGPEYEQFKVRLKLLNVKLDELLMSSDFEDELNKL